MKYAKPNVIIIYLFYFFCIIGLIRCETTPFVWKETKMVNPIEELKNP